MASDGLEWRPKAIGSHWEPFVACNGFEWLALATESHKWPERLLIAAEDGAIILVSSNIIL